MAICGHQFRAGDGSDWILSTSAGSLDGSTTACRILEELFKKHCRSMPNKTPRKRPKTVTAPSENLSPPKPETNGTKPFKVENENLIVKKITGTSSFDNFDESQHLNGCPMKWLYQKKLLEKNKTYKVARPCNKKTVKKEEVKKEKSKNLRDKTPIEVKIHKINLIEKYTNSCDEVFAPYLSFSSEKSSKDIKELETHKKKLAAKLNWKLHDETQEDSLETSSEVSSRHNYLPPRPLLGLKPLLSVLLAPQQENCCSLVTLPNTSRKKTKMEASLSIQSLDLSLTLPDSKPQERTTNALRWGSKSSIHAKKLQIPNPITIKLEEKKKAVTNSMNQLKVVFNTSPAKKNSERTKHAKSLSSLFYELKGKTNCRHANEMYFEEMIRDLTMEEGKFKIKRFLNIGSAKSDLCQGWQINLEKRKNLVRTVSTESELNLVCGKVRFFQKKSSQGIKQEENKNEEH